MEHETKDKIKTFVNPPENFLNFIRSLVKTSEDIDVFRSALKTLYMTKNIKRVVISGPASSGKSLLAEVIREIAQSTPAFHNDFKISTNLSSVTRPFYQTAGDVLFFNFTKTISNENRDPYLYCKITKEISDIVNWLQN